MRAVARILLLSLIVIASTTDDFDIHDDDFEIHDDIEAVFREGAASEQTSTPTVARSGQSAPAPASSDESTNGRTSAASPPTHEHDGP